MSDAENDGSTYIIICAPLEYDLIFTAHARNADRCIS